MRVARGLLTLMLVLGASCGREEQSVGSEAIVVSTPQELPGFARGDARLSVTHSGVRRLEFAPVSGQGVSFRERITTDGHGKYSLEAVSLLGSSNLEWEVFAMFQRAREGFHFRYRDFHVHDPVLFVRNWRTTKLGQAAPIAGRNCEHFRIERAVGAPVSYEIFADVETGLVLGSRQYDATGELIASMTYESFQLHPPLAGIAWHQQSNGERQLDLLGELSEQLGSRALLPRILPTGYVQQEAALVAGEETSDWLKLTYTDGIQPLFFLQSARDRTVGRLAQPGSTTPARDPAPSSVVTFQVGAAMVIQGIVEGFDLIVIGMASEVELLDVIESSLP